MPSLSDQLFGGVWLLWLMYWGISALRVKPAMRVESRASRLGRHVLLVILAALLLRRYAWLNGSFLNERFVPDQMWIVWLGFGVTVIGLAFTCWARVVLGQNWSGTVQLKQDHELIVRGPYSFVRHPIYTGVLVAFFGTVLRSAMTSGQGWPFDQSQYLLLNLAIGGTGGGTPGTTVGALSTGGSTMLVDWVRTGAGLPPDAQ